MEHGPMKFEKFKKFEKLLLVLSSGQIFKHVLIHFFHSFYCRRVDDRGRMASWKPTNIPWNNTHCHYNDSAYRLSW